MASSCCFGRKRNRSSQANGDDNCSLGKVEHDVPAAMEQPANTVESVERTLLLSMPDMCIYCFEVLRNHLFKTKRSPGVPAFLDVRYPLFVSWKAGQRRRLRGCIGTFNAVRLQRGLRDYALLAAQKDNRFQPIGPEEFRHLTVSVSLLYGFQSADSFHDWTVGTHGVRIEFRNERGAKRSATFLPQVARDQGWNQTQTIDALLRKGGFRGVITPAIRDAVNVVRYHALEFLMDYREYRSRRLCIERAHSELEPAGTS